MSTTVNLTNLGAIFKTANADQGHGLLGPWPEEPTPKEDLIVFLEDISVEPRDWNYNHDGQKKTREGVRIQMAYTWPDGPDGPMEFKGAPIDLPLDASNLPSNQLDRVRIASGKLKGYALGVTAVEHDDPQAALQTMLDALNEHKSAGTAMKVVLKTSYPERSDKKGYDKRDYIQHVVAS